MKNTIKKILTYAVVPLLIMVDGCYKGIPQEQEKDPLPIMSNGYRGREFLYHGFHIRIDPDGGIRYRITEFGEKEKGHDAVVVAGVKFVHSFIHTKTALDSILQADIPFDELHAWGIDSKSLLYNTCSPRQIDSLVREALDADKQLDNWP